uniref:CWH43-like N-terminal domain-containing protein n=1 Tax=Palpitomonas bilix TaxID=652834 RepID=A0A7S3LXB5_9EUKA|mmetsp:Transcript_801/g.1451  ORF Transcript_801/g.1451 Transcript_801/m.1451 type:complete len:267 (+) Transcript_801:89-889(+)
MGASKGLPMPILFPILTIIGGLGTVITTLTIAKTTPNYSIGGIEFPYISDTGRDPPAYYVFVIGMVLNAVLFICDGAENFLRVRTAATLILDNQAKAKNIRIALASLIFTVIASLALSLLAGLDTRNYPDMHNYSAYLFFLCAVVFMSLTTANFSALAKANPFFRRHFQLRISIVVCLSLFFTCYIIIGLALVYTYCGGWTIDPVSGLYDYSGCAGVHTFRAITQYLTILSVIAFPCSLVYDFSNPSPSPAIMSAQKQNGDATYPL